MTHQQALSTSASERYLLGEMTEPERSTFEEHYFSCTECAEDVRTLAVMQEGGNEAQTDAGAQSMVFPSVATRNCKLAVRNGFAIVLVGGEGVIEHPPCFQQQIFIGRRSREI